MFRVTRKEVEELRRQYPKGTRVELISMRDIQAPPPGTCGVIQGVDDAGSILVRWNNGSSLSLIYGEDSFRIIE